MVVQIRACPRGGVRQYIKERKTLPHRPHPHPPRHLRKRDTIFKELVKAVEEVTK